MTKNKNYRKQLKSQYRSLEEHSKKLADERQKPIEEQDAGLVIHWEKTVANCRQQITKLERRLNRMTTTALYEKSLTSLRRHLEEYRPQLEKALAAIAILEAAEPGSEEFGDALAELHVGATVLEPYSEGMVIAIDEFTEDQPD